MALPSIEAFFKGHPELAPMVEDSPPPETPATPVKPPMGATRSFDLSLKGMVKQLDTRARGGLDPFDLSTLPGRFLKPNEPSTPREPGIWAPEEKPLGPQALEFIGGRTLTQPSAVIQELILSPDRLQTAKEVVKDVANLSLRIPIMLLSQGAELVDTLGNPKSTPDEIGSQAALLGLGSLFTKVGRGAILGPMKYAFKGVKGTLDLATRPISYIDEKLAPVTNYVWDNIVTKPFTARIIPTLEKLPEGRGAMEVVKKSIADIMQPAVERVGPKLQSTFRGVQAMKAHTTRIGKEMGQDLREVSPTARYEVIKSLRGTPMGALRTKEAGEIINKFDERIHDAQLKSPYEVEFKDRLSKLLTKRVDTPEDIFLGEQPYTFLKTIEAGIQGKASVKQVQKALVRVIEDPLVSPEFKQLARMVHDLPASIPEEVAEASKASSTAFLASKLKGYRGVVRAYDPNPGSGDYLKSKWAPFVSSKGDPLYVQRDVELELRTLQEIPKIAHGIFNKYFMSPWKIMKVMLRPATNIRNDFTNLMQNHVHGLPFWHMEPYIDGTLGMMGKGKRVTDVKRFMRTTAAGGNFSVNEVNTMYEGLKYGSNMLDSAMSRFEQMIAPAKTMYNAQETMFKVAKYLHNLDKGMQHTEAVWDAVKTTFNYGEITRFTAQIRTKVAPFYTWQSKIIPQMAEAAVKHPVQFTTMITLYQTLQNYGIQESGITDAEWQEVEGKLPEYIKKGMFLVLPWRDENKRLNLMNMTYMIPGFGDLNQFASRPFNFFLSNPALTISSALLTKQKYSGAPLYYDWEAPGTKFAKATSYMWEQLMPAIVPGGTDWNMMYESFTDVPDSMTGPQALSSALGFKVTPLDLEAAQRKSNAFTQIHLSEMGSQMNQEMRKAKSEEQKQKIIEKYIKLRASVTNEEVK